jgi:ParB family chromosome partitioning protein
MDQFQLVRREDIELGDNVRDWIDDYETKCLAVSIRERGIEIPLELEPGTTKPYRLRDGFRRFAASGLVGLEILPARVHPAQQSEGERIECQLTINCNRVDISAWARAVAIRRLMEQTGRNAKDTARRLGMSSTMVSNLLSLLALPEPIQQQLKAGKLQTGTACEIARVKDPAKQMALAGLAANGQLTRDAVSRTTKRRTSPRPAPRATRTKRCTLPLGDGSSMTIAGPELSLDILVQWLDRLIGQAKEARIQGITFEAFTKLLKEQLKATV